MYPRRKCCFTVSPPLPVRAAGQNAAFSESHHPARLGYFSIVCREVGRTTPLKTAQQKQGKTTMRNSLNNDQDSNCGRVEPSLVLGRIQPVAPRQSLVIVYWDMYMIHHLSPVISTPSCPPPPSRIRAPAEDPRYLITCVRPRKNYRTFFLGQGKPAWEARSCQTSKVQIRSVTTALTRDEVGLTKELAITLSAHCHAS